MENGLEVNAPSVSRAIVISSSGECGGAGGTGWFEVLGQSKYVSEEKELPKATELGEQGGGGQAEGD